nr:insulinase family protein [Bacteroidota bacterium]
LFGYIGCQGDKSSEAITTMLDLLKQMPEKPERIESIRTGLIDEAYSGRPGFRQLSQRVEYWQRMGFTTDPNAQYVLAYPSLEFADITAYYQSSIQKLPVSIAIVGNKKNLPIAELKKLGKVIFLKEKDIRI